MSNDGNCFFNALESASYALIKQTLTLLSIFLFHYIIQIELKLQKFQE
jgi:hypothetical protein